MFSQFRQAVENFAPQPRRSLDSGDDLRESPSRSNSLDSQARPSSPLSSSQLAESALTNLRKSLATQRTSGPRSAGISNTNKPKSTLEDRLRAAATLAIGETPSATSPDASPSVSSPSTAVTDNSPPPSVADSPTPDKPAQDAEGPAVTECEEKVIESPVTAISPEGNEAMETIHSKEELLDSSTPIPLVSSAISPNVEELQERLKQVEERFTEVSTSFKKLQLEKAATDSILRELTPLESTQDSAALRQYIQSMSSKLELSKEEAKQLNVKLQGHDDRIQELRDTHRLESASQSSQIEKLRMQLDEAEVLLKATHNTNTQAEADAVKHKLDLDQLQTEVDRAKSFAKEEEEKRVKAVSLLKTVRQKLVKAEKERDDLVKEMGSFREKEKEAREKEQAERERLHSQVDAMNAEREKLVASLKAQLDKEIASLKDHYEKEISVQREQFDLEKVTLKDTHSAELSSIRSHISTLESSLKKVVLEKDGLFDHLQLRQAELESAQSHLESLQSQKTELEYQLRETADRYALLKEELAESRREQESRLREPVSTAGEVARLLSVTEAKYEAKISALKKNINALEKERNDADAEWSRKLRSKIQEAEELKSVVGSAAQAHEHDEEIVSKLKAEVKKSEDDYRLLQQQLSELRLSSSKVKDAERLGKAQESELNTRISVLERQVEEAKLRETQLKLTNKTLREELKKVQSSAALLERQRNPGVGYWTSRTVDGPADTRTSISSNSSDPPSRVDSPIPASSPQLKNEEEVNLEYLRNVILQFLEHKDMRPNLVKVLSIILRFTPQETRRLIAKV